MSNIEKIKVGSTTYPIRDANTLRSLNSTQAAQIVLDGTYNGEAVEDGEVFTNDTGKFQEFVKTANQAYSFLQKSFSYADFPCASSDKFFNFRKSGSPTTVQVSSNGVNWTDKTLTQSMSNVLSGFVEGNGKLIMLQPEASKQYTSTDGGDTWSYSSPSLPSGSNYLTDGHYIPGFYIFAQFYLNSLNGFIYSTDGSTWTQGSLPDNASSYGCFTSDGTYFYYLERDHGYLYKTSDCVNWSLVGTSSVVPDAFTVLKHYQGKFWTYQYNYSDNTSIFYSLKYSPDGLTWSSVGTISHPNTSYNYTKQFKLGYCGSSSSGVFVIAYFDLESTAYAPSKAFYMSPDGINWTENNESSSYRYSSKFIGNLISGIICGTNSPSVKIDAVTTYTYSLTDLSMTASEVSSQGFLKNKTSTTGGLAILGTANNSYTYQTVVGETAASSVAYSVALGYYARAASSSGATAVGNRAYAYSGTAVGCDAQTYNNSIAIGFNSNTGSQTYGTYASDHSIAIGTHALAGTNTYGTNSKAYTIAIGNGAVASGTHAIAIGSGNWVTPESKATADYAIQIGKGTNSTTKTLSIGLDDTHNYELLSADGTIPKARLANALSNASVTLEAASWSGGSQTVTVSGMTATAVVIVSPAPASASEYASAGVICSAQAADSLTFTCSTTPTSDLTVNVIFN